MKSDRIKTNISGLDEIIGGGIPCNSSLVVVGGPGAGKTTFSAQFVYNGAKNSEKGAILLIGQGKEKFERDVSSFGINFAEFEKKGLVKIYELPVYDKKFDANFSNMVLELSSFAPKRIVMDSFSIFFSSIENREKHREMIRTLKYLTRESTLLLTIEKHNAEKVEYPDEYFASDAVIELGTEGSSRKQRIMRVLKMRQTHHSLEPLSYRLSDGGISIIQQPKMEHPESVSYKKMSTGIEGLDKSLDGGFFGGTVVLLAGNSGTGKTIMGMNFLLEGAKKKEKSLFISFEESENEIARNISSLGFDVRGMSRSGKLDFYTVYPENIMPHELMQKLNEIIAKGNYKRIVLDSITRLARSLDEPQYMELLKRLCALTRSKMATLMLLGEVKDENNITAVSEMDISSLVEGIILLKHIELLGEMRRSMMIIKLRGVKHDKMIKEFAISEGGVKIIGNLKNIETMIPSVSEVD